MDLDPVIVGVGDRNKLGLAVARVGEAYPHAKGQRVLALAGARLICKVLRPERDEAHDEREGQKTESVSCCKFSCVLIGVLLPPINGPRDRPRPISYVECDALLLLLNVRSDVEFWRRAHAP